MTVILGCTMIQKYVQIQAQTSHDSSEHVLHVCIHVYKYMYDDFSWSGLSAGFSLNRELTLDFFWSSTALHMLKC